MKVKNFKKFNIIMTILLLNAQLNYTGFCLSYNLPPQEANSMVEVANPISFPSSTISFPHTIEDVQVPEELALFKEFIENTNIYDSAFKEKINSNWKFQIFTPPVKLDYEEYTFISDPIENILPEYSDIQKIIEICYLNNMENPNNFESGLKELLEGVVTIEKNNLYEYGYNGYLNDYRLFIQIDSQGLRINWYKIQDGEHEDLLYEKILRINKETGEMMNYYNIIQHYPERSISYFFKTRLKLERRIWNMELYQIRTLEDWTKELSGEEVVGEDSKLWEIQGNFNLPEEIEIKYPDLSILDSEKNEILEFYFQLNNLEDNLPTGLGDLFLGETKEKWNLFQEAITDDNPYGFIASAVHLLSGNEESTLEEALETVGIAGLLTTKSINVTEAYRNARLLNLPLDETITYIEKMTSGEQELTISSENGAEFVYRWDIETSERGIPLLVERLIYRDTEEGQEGEVYRRESKFLFQGNAWVAQMRYILLPEDEELHQEMEIEKTYSSQAVDITVSSGDTVSTAHYEVTNEGNGYRISNSQMSVYIENEGNFTIDYTSSESFYHIEASKGDSGEVLMIQKDGEEIYKEEIIFRDGTIVRTIDVAKEFISEELLEELQIEPEIFGSLNRIEISINIDYSLFDEPRENNFLSPDIMLESKWYAENQPYPELLSKNLVWKALKSKFVSLRELKELLPQGIKDGDITLYIQGELSDLSFVGLGRENWHIRDGRIERYEGDVGRITFQYSSGESSKFSTINFELLDGQVFTLNVTYDESENVNKIEIYNRQGVKVYNYLGDKNFREEWIADEAGTVRIYSYYYESEAGKRLEEWESDERGEKIAYYQDTQLDEDTYDYIKWQKDPGADYKVTYWEEGHSTPDGFRLYVIEPHARTLWGEPLLPGSKFVLQEVITDSEGTVTMYSLHELNAPQELNELLSRDKQIEDLSVKEVYREELWNVEEGKKLYNCIINDKEQGLFRVIKGIDEKGNVTELSLYTKTAEGESIRFLDLQKCLEEDYSSYDTVLDAIKRDSSLGYKDGDKIGIGAALGYLLNKRLDFLESQLFVDGELKEEVITLMDRFYEENKMTLENQGFPTVPIRNMSNLVGLDVVYFHMVKAWIDSYAGPEDNDTIQHWKEIADHLLEWRELGGLLHEPMSFLPRLKRCFEYGELDWLKTEGERLLALGLVYKYGTESEPWKPLSSPSEWILDLGEGYKIAIGSGEEEQEGVKGFVTRAPRAVEINTQGMMVISQGGNYYPYEVDFSQGRYVKVGLRDIRSLFAKPEFRQAYASVYPDGDIDAFRSQFESMHCFTTFVRMFIRAAGHGLESIDPTRRQMGDVLAELFDSDNYDLSGWSEEEKLKALVLLYEIEGYDPAVGLETAERNFLIRLQKYGLFTGDDVSIYLPRYQDTSAFEAGIDSFFTVLFGYQMLKVIKALPSAFSRLTGYFKGGQLGALFKEGGVGIRSVVDDALGILRGGADDDLIRAIIFRKRAIAEALVKRSMWENFRGFSLHGLLRTMQGYGTFLGILNILKSGASWEERWQAFKYGYSMGAGTGGFLYLVSRITAPLFARTTKLIFGDAFIPQGVTDLLTPLGTGGYKTQFLTYKLLSHLVPVRYLPSIDSIALFWGGLLNLYFRGIEPGITALENKGVIAPETGKWLRLGGGLFTLLFASAGIVYNPPKFRLSPSPGREDIPIDILYSEDGMMYVFDRQTGKITVLGRPQSHILLGVDYKFRSFDVLPRKAEAFQRVLTREVLRGGRLGVDFRLSPARGYHRVYLTIDGRPSMEVFIDENRYGKLVSLLKEFGFWEPFNAPFSLNTKGLGLLGEAGKEYIRWIEETLK